ncbi:MAG TPA: heavy metal response regulator transcription factor [Alphaproteobacteria bacterium]
MKLLLIEDDPTATHYLQRGLGENGFEVDVCRDGDAGLQQALFGDHALIVLDVMLPGKSGWDIISDLRRCGRDTPVLFLTARDSVRDRVRGLELGADDYLVKPFAFAELLARVRRLMRRTPPERKSDTLVVADLTIETRRQRVTRAGEPVDLTPKEFMLLSLLAEHAGETLSRTHIAEQVWNVNFDGDTNVVDVNIRRLRAKVDDPFERKLIHTVRGLGYVLRS